MILRSVQSNDRFDPAAGKTVIHDEEEED